MSRQPAGTRRSALAVLLLGVGLALGVALLSPLASSEPDGLERVAEDQGFIDAAHEPGYSIIPDYQVPGVEDERVATVLAGVVGVLAVTAVTFTAGKLLARRERARSARSSADAGGRR